MNEWTIKIKYRYYSDLYNLYPNFWKVPININARYTDPINLQNMTIRDYFGDVNIGKQIMVIQNCLLSMLTYWPNTKTDIGDLADHLQVSTPSGQINIYTHSLKWKLLLILSGNHTYAKHESLCPPSTSAQQLCMRPLDNGKQGMENQSNHSTQTVKNF